MKSLKNKVVWITGASDGIGKELAIQLAREGAKIILTARNVANLNEVKDRLEGEEHWVCLSENHLRYSNHRLQLQFSVNYKLTPAAV